MKNNNLYPLAFILQHSHFNTYFVYAKNLVIVESPAKAKTIEKFLGKDYRVMSSFGHIRDLKEKDFGIDIATNPTM